MKRPRNSSDAEEEESPRNMNGTILQHIVNNGVFDGYRTLLQLCEATNTLCSFLLDPVLPIFKEPVLRGMDTEKLENVFRLFAEHRCGGRQFFNQMLRHFPFVEERVVDVFWAQTAAIWQYDVDLPLLQQTAIVSTHPWLLRKLLHANVCDSPRIPRGALHVVGNVEACHMLLRSGRFEVNNTQDWHGTGVTPLYNARSREVAACLLEAHADVIRVLECSNFLPGLR